MFRVNREHFRLLDDHLIRSEAAALRLMTFARSFTARDNSLSLTGVRDENESIS